MAPRDRKYGEVTTEHGNIPDDEPVIVFRARDAEVPEMLRYYLHLCKVAGTTDRHIELVTESRDAIVQWQADHPDRVQVPVSDPANLR